MKKQYRILAAALASVLAVGGLSGCKAKDEDGESVKLSWWIANSASPIVKDYNEIEAVKKWTEKFNVKIEFVHPSTQQETEQFNIMAASGDFKDIVTYNWNGYTGGPAKASKDGAIIILDDYLEEYMPNLLGMMKTDQAINYAARDYEGAVTVLPSFTDSVVTEATFGPQIRKDWLDKLGLSVPTTIDEWHTVLTAFKTQDPNGNGQADEIPFMADGTATFTRFTAAFNGVGEGFYVDGEGKIRFGFIEPDFRDFLTTMNQWYEEGLIYAEYAAADAATLDNKMTTGVGGAFVGYSGSAMGKYTAAARAENPDYTLVGTPWPKSADGNAYCGYTYQAVRGIPGKGMAISTKNKNVERSLELIDYLYGEEGSTLMNWGIEGESYTKTDDGYHFTDNIMKNSEGKSPVEAISSYALTQWPIAMKRADAFMELNSVYPEQKDAMTLWSEADISRIMPNLTVSPEEQAEITKVMDDIYLLKKEWQHKLIMGVEPMEKWDEVVEQMKSMGIDKAIEVYQTAYDRYLNQ